MAVTDFQFHVVAPNRDKCLSEMDAISLGIQQVIGGDPWMAVDDDVARRPLTNEPKNEDDFTYHGTKRMIYMGPATIRDMEGFPPGVTPQDVDKNGDNP